jgi:ElaB/YqjD/DUF883 family membrane-anchored ribosome-binding protein
MEAARALNDLVNDTEELLAELSARKGPDVEEIRERLQSSIAQTRGLLEKDRELNGVGVRDVAVALNEFVRHYPWMALATGVLLASSLGILATMATRRSAVRQLPD